MYAYFSSNGSLHASCLISLTPGIISNMTIIYILYQLTFKDITTTRITSIVNTMLLHHPTKVNTAPVAGAVPGGGAGVTMAMITVTRVGEEAVATDTTCASMAVLV